MSFALSSGHRPLASACAVVSLAVLASLALSLAERAAAAQEPRGCAAGSVQAEMCTRALALQNAYIARVPMSVGSSATLMTMTANGPTLNAVVIWKRSAAQIKAYLQEGNLLRSDFESRLSDGARSVVCSEVPLAEFVRLGGRINYLYTTTDGVELSAPVVRDCPKAQ